MLCDVGWKSTSWGCTDFIRFFGIFWDFCLFFWGLGDYSFLIGVFGFGYDICIRLTSLVVI